VFWRSFLLEADPGNEHATLRVTSLRPRCLPLVRYEIGDEIVPDRDLAGLAVGLATFDRVVGRCNDYLVMADGVLVHSEAISHAVRPCRPIRVYQARQEGNEIRLVYAADVHLTGDEEAGVRERLRRIHRDLERIAFERVDTLPQTVAGKTPMIVRRP
jgi:phenylacetate-CoA ligase